MICVFVMNPIRALCAYMSNVICNYTDTFGANSIKSTSMSGSSVKRERKGGGLLAANARYRAMLIYTLATSLRR